MFLSNTIVLTLTDVNARDATGKGLKIKTVTAISDRWHFN
jgi:hypothetical protein